MINRTTLVGRLANDPELRYTTNGVAVASFRIAVNRPFTNKNGEKEADFINIIVWKKAAEAAANYLSKGKLAGIDGRIQTRNYENGEGRRIYLTEVVAENVQFLEPKNKSSNNQNQQYTPPQNQQYSNNQPQQNDQLNDPFAQEGKPIDINDDDLPF